MQDNPYETLGLTDRSATAAEVAKAYKRMTLTCHPDRYPGDPLAAEKFDKVCKANKLLSDPTERSLFDQGINTGDGGDIFATLARMFAGGAPSNDGQDGVDVHAPPRGSSGPGGAARGNFTSTSTSTTTNADGSTTTVVKTTGANGIVNTSTTTVGGPQKGDVHQVPTRIAVGLQNLQYTVPAEGFLCTLAQDGLYDFVTGDQLGEMLNSQRILIPGNFYYKATNGRFYHPEAILRV
jgi:hypothetical protein